MAILKGQLIFTGTIGDLTAYKRRDSDKIIIRQKGGPSKSKIKKSRKFDLVRKNNAEFGGRATATKWIRQAMWPQKSLADYGFTSSLNSLMKPMQELDTVSDLGRRSVLFTKNPHLLSGFNLNRRNIFDSIVRNPVIFSIHKESLSASLAIPSLVPGINFFTPGNMAMYSIVATLGILPDLHFNANGYRPQKPYKDQVLPAVFETKWHPTLSSSPAETIEMKLTTIPPDESFCLLLSIGIRFGNIIDEGKVKQEKYAGAAKILWVT